MVYFFCFFYGLNLINENLFFFCLVYFYKCRVSILLGGGGKIRKLKNLVGKEKKLFLNWYIIDMFMIYFDFFLKEKWKNLFRI